MPAGKKKAAAKRRRTVRKASRVRELAVHSWPDFIAIIQQWPGSRNWAFRGQGDASWPLRTTLSRHIDVSGVCEAAWPRQEERIRRIFERKSHLYIQDPPGDDELEWLALMQHHGAPTRLLDLTWSPFAAAFFALEHASGPAAVWALNLALLWRLHTRYQIDGIRVTDANPRDPDAYAEYYLHNDHAFVWQGDPFRMPQRVVAQSGTFLLVGHLGLTVEQIIERYPGRGELLVKLVLDTERLREQAMASLYSMNITQSTLFPGLDGLARSMAYEFEYSWQIDVRTNEPRPSLQRPRTLPKVLDRG